MIKDIPTDLKNDFKLLCMKRNTNMKETVTGFIKEEVEKAKRDPKQKDLFL